MLTSLVTFGRDKKFKYHTSIMSEPLKVIHKPVAYEQLYTDYIFIWETGESGDMHM